MVHCPEPLVGALRAQFRIWVRRKAGRLAAKALKFEAVGRGNPTVTAALGFGTYICKGADAATAEKFGIDAEDQGRVYGKRVRVSQDIGAAAQARYEALMAAPLREAA